MQPQTHVPIASRPFDGDGRAPPSARRRLVPVPSDLSAVLTDLSATVCQLRGLQQLHAGDGVQAQLRRTAAELEALIAALLHTDVAGPAPPAPPPAVDTPQKRAAEQAFSTWLAAPTDANERTLAGGDASGSLARVLGELSLSRRVLPAETAAGVGLADGTTLGHAAAEVLLAVKDPAGPRCRSFRAAVYYLRNLDRDCLAWPDAGEVVR